jgi:hypothetical protein
MQVLVIAGVWLAFGLNMLARLAGIVALVWQQHARLLPAQWFLLGGFLGGLALYLCLSQSGSNNQYFLRTGFTFGVLLSAWGYVLVLDRARLSRPAMTALAWGTSGFAVLLVAIQLRFAGAQPAGPGAYQALVPIWRWAAVLAGVVAVAGVVVLLVMVVLLAMDSRPRASSAGTRQQLRNRVGLACLTIVMVAGAPGLVMDSYKSIKSPNGGAYALISLPKSRVDAARWLRAHTDPDEVVATNAHCLGYWGQLCDSRSFWLSAYSERSVLVEGWGFAPRMAPTGLTHFWDQPKLDLNDAAFTAPTAQVLGELVRRYGVRWLVVDRRVAREAPGLGRLATLRYDNGRIAIYRVDSLQ